MRQPPMQLPPMQQLPRTCRVFTISARLPPAWAHGATRLWAYGAQGHKCGEGCFMSGCTVARFHGCMGAWGKQCSCTNKVTRSCPCPCIGYPTPCRPSVPRLFLTLAFPGMHSLTCAWPQVECHQVCPSCCGQVDVTGGQGAHTRVEHLGWSVGEKSNQPMMAGKAWV